MYINEKTKQDWKVVREKGDTAKLAKKLKLKYNNVSAIMSGNRHVTFLGIQKIEAFIKAKYASPSIVAKLKYLKGK